MLAVLCIYVENNWIIEIKTSNIEIWSSTNIACTLSINCGIKSRSGEAWSLNIKVFSLCVSYKCSNYAVLWSQVWHKLLLFSLIQISAWRPKQVFSNFCLPLKYLLKVLIKFIFLHDWSSLLKAKPWATLRLMISLTVKSA